MRKIVMLVTLGLVLAAGAAAVLTVYPQPASAEPQELARTRRMRQPLPLTIETIM